MKFSAGTNVLFVRKKNTTLTDEIRKQEGCLVQFLLNPSAAHSLHFAIEWEDRNNNAVDFSSACYN